MLEEPEPSAEDEAEEDEAEEDVDDVCELFATAGPSDECWVEFRGPDGSVLFHCLLWEGCLLSRESADGFSSCASFLLAVR